MTTHKTHIKTHIYNVAMGLCSGHMQWAYAIRPYVSYQWDYIYVRILFL